jgi:hypothetical protein
LIDNLDQDPTQADINDYVNHITEMYIEQRNIYPRDEALQEVWRIRRLAHVRDNLSRFPERPNAYPAYPAGEDSLTLQQIGAANQQGRGGHGGEITSVNFIKKKT